MMSTATSARPAIRRPALLTLVVALLSISLVWSSQGRASADIWSSLAEVGETLTGPAADGVVEGGVAGAAEAGMCASGIGTAACIGLAAWGTKDIWWPTVSGWLGSAFSSDTPQPRISCTATLSGQAVTETCVTTGGEAEGWMHVDGSECETAAGNVQAGDTEVIGADDWNDGTHVQTWNVCPSGTTVVYAHGSGSFPSGTDTPWQVGSQVPVSDLSVTTTVTCVNGGGVTQTISATAGPADEADNGEGIPFPSCQAADPGSVPEQVQVASGLAGAQHSDVTATWNSPNTEYPNCFDSSGNWLATCVVRVYVNGQPCHVGASGCTNWETAAADDGDTVECRLGPDYTLPLNDCSALANQYKTTAGTVTVSEPGAEGQLGDQTGDGSDSSGDSSTDSLPDSGDDSDVDQGDGEDCGGTWGWNPIEWVEKPVKCAIEWAFEPDVSDWGLDDLQEAFTTRPPGSLVTGLAQTVTAAYDGYEGAGCGTIADFGRVGSDPDVALSCATISAQGGVHDIYVAVQVALWGVTAFAVFRLVLGALSAKAS